MEKFPFRFVSVPFSIFLTVFRFSVLPFTVLFPFSYRAVSVLFTLTSGKLITAAPYRGVLSAAQNRPSYRVSDYSSSRMVFTEYTKQSILFYHQRGIRPPQIKRLLQENCRQHAGHREVYSAVCSVWYYCQVAVFLSRKKLSLALHAPFIAPRHCTALHYINCFYRDRRMVKLIASNK